MSSEKELTHDDGLKQAQQVVSAQAVAVTVFTARACNVFALTPYGRRS